MNTNQSISLTREFEDPGYILRHGILVTIILSIAYGFVFIVGVFGNTAVVWIIFRTPRMRTKTNQFIANLAFADLLVNILCVPFTLVGNLFPAWILGSFFCKFVSYSQGVSVSASVNTLMAMSIERCAAILYPLSGIMTERQYKCSVIIIWLFAVIINLPWLFVFHLEPLDIHTSDAEICIELWPSELSQNIFFVIANLTSCYLGPLFVISICYLIIWYTVVHRNVPGEQIAGNNNSIVLNRTKIKVIKMVFVVIISFAICWLPLYSIFCIAKLWNDLMFNEKIQPVILAILPIAQWLGASNSCINPILYGFMNNKFRHEFKIVFERLCSLKKNTLGKDVCNLNISQNHIKSVSEEDQISLGTESTFVSTYL